MLFARPVVPFVRVAGFPLVCDEIFAIFADAAVDIDAGIDAAFSVTRVTLFGMALVSVGGRDMGS